MGNSVDFAFTIHTNKTEKLMIDYIIGFQGKNNMLLPKVFKIKKCTLQKETATLIEKKHVLKVMTTKRLYPGKHYVQLQINGALHGKQFFMLEL